MRDISPARANASAMASSGAQPRSHTGRWIVGVLVASLLLASLGGWDSLNQYNAIQFNDEIADAEWSQLMSQYKRRADLVPNIVSVVRAYASHESQLFNEITAARAGAAAVPTSAINSRDLRSVDQFQQAQNKLSAPLIRLLAVVENYPDLKASELYRDLMVQLEGTENRIAYSRQRYIGAIAEYNFGIRRFPNNLIAKQAGYSMRAKFSVEDEPIFARVPSIDLK